jgi:preprotein translocase subunit YajC
MEQFLIIILMFGALYYLLLRPQQKREKARRELVRSLQAGDEVVTNAGIHGVVAEVEDAVVWLEVAPNVELKLSRDAIHGREPAASDSDDDEADDEADDDADTDEEHDG